MSYLNDLVLDAALTVLDTGPDKLFILSSEPATFAAATAAKLAEKTLGASDISAPSARTGGGRKVTIAATTGANVTAGGTATSWALVNSGTSVLYAAGALPASQVLTVGNPFTTAPFDIGIPGPV
jgi:hypothetical protein